MNENLPKPLAIFLIIIGIVVCFLSQLLSAEYSEVAGWYGMIQSSINTMVAFFWIVTILGVATVIIGVVLIMWSNERTSKKKDEEHLPPPLL